VAPNSRFGLALSAEYYAQTNHAPEAEELLTRLTRDNPDEVDSALAVAAIRKRAGKADEALAVLEAFHQRHPAEPLAVAALVGYYDGSNHPERSVALLDKCRAANPDSEVFLRLGAEELAAQGHNQEAEALLRQGLERFPASDDLLAALARFLHGRERAADVVPVVQSFIARNGATTERLYLLVNFLEESGQRPAVIPLLQRILTVMPDHTGANNDLGFFWADGGTHLDEALHMINRALDNEPNNSAFRDSLGWVYYKRGQFAKAIEELTQAVSLPRGQQVEGFSHLADALYRAGRQDEARERYEQAKALLDQPDQPAHTAPAGVHVLAALQQMKNGGAVETAPLGKAE